MSKWMLACGAVTLAGFLAVPASAQTEPVQLPKSVTAQAQLVPMTIVHQERGRLGRTRTWRETVMVNPSTMNIQQVEGTKTTEPGVKQAQGTKPGSAELVPMTITHQERGRFGRMRTWNETVMVDPSTTNIQRTEGTKPTEPGSGIKQAQFTEPQVIVDQRGRQVIVNGDTQVVERRQGLFGRLRARR